MSFTLEQYFAAAQELRIAVAERKDISKFGLIKAHTSKNPELKGVYLLNYAPEAAFRKAEEWNIYERVSRGLVVDHCQILAFPFPKFFNLGEEVEHFSVDDIECVTKKEDGSLGITFVYNGKLFVTTHGGLDSKQGIWATNFVRQKYNESGLAASIGSGGDWTRTTFLVEIVYPENRIVTNYGEKEALLPLAKYTFNQHTGTIVHKSLAKQVPIQTCEELVAFAKENTDFNDEGVVVLLKNGNRVKVKTDAYLAVHRIRFQCTEKRVHEILMNSPEVFDEWKKTLPNEFFEEVEQHRRNIISTVSKHVLYAQELLLDERLGVGTIGFSNLAYSERKRKIALFLKEQKVNTVHFHLCLKMYEHGYKVSLDMALSQYFKLKELEIF